MGVPSLVSFFRSCFSENKIGPSKSLRSRIRAKKNEFLRASPIAQYSRPSDSMAQMEGKPIRRAPEETCKPIAAEMAMRVPAYEPGPRPTRIVSGAPRSEEHTSELQSRRD